MAVDFDGSSQRLNCGSLATLDNIALVTYAAWIYGDSFPAYHVFFDKRIPGNNFSGPASYLFDASGATVRLYFLQGWTTYGIWHTTNRDILSGVWMHVAITYSRSSTANNPILYINGVSKAITCDQAPATTVGDDSTASVFVGADGNNVNWFDGRMEDARIFNRILTPSEVAILAAGYRGPLGGEVLWLPMDGARATPVFDGATLAVNTNYLNDVSGNGNHGNPTGNPLGKASTCPRTNLWIPQHTKLLTWLAPAVKNWLRQHGRQSYYKWI